MAVFHEHQLKTNKSFQTRAGSHGRALHPSTVNGRINTQKVHTLLNRCKPSAHRNTRVMMHNRRHESHHLLLSAHVHVGCAIGLLTDLWIIFKVKILYSLQSNDSHYNLVLCSSSNRYSTGNLRCGEFPGWGKQSDQSEPEGFSLCECVRARWPTNMCRASVWTVPLTFVSVRPRHACQAEPQLLRH